MPAIPFINVITARPSETRANHTKCMAAAVAAGYVGIRFDASFESVYPTTSTSDYSGIDMLLEEAAAAGITHIWFSVGPYPNTTHASYTAIFGTYGSSARLVKKRPPAGTDNAGWQLLTDRSNTLIAYVVAKWVALGRLASSVYFSVWQEVATGAADGPQTTDVVGGSNARAAMIAAGYEGKLDSDSDWDSLGGVAGYLNVRGIHEIMDFMYPQIVVPAGAIWVLPAFENQGGGYTAGTAAAAEVASYFNPSHTWQDAYFETVGAYHMDVHVYYGDISGLFGRVPALYSKQSLRLFCAMRSTLKAAYPSRLSDPEIPVYWHISEYGVKPEWLFGTATDAAYWTHEMYGNFLEALTYDLENLTGCQTIALEEIMTDPTYGTETFGVINAAGNTSVAIAGIGRAHGVHINPGAASPPWGGSWRKGTAETPVDDPV